MRFVNYKTGNSATSLFAVLPVMFILLLAGCPASTPQERVAQLGPKITDRGGGVLDLDFSGTSVKDDDLQYINAFCANSGEKWKAIDTLNLSDTAITDKALEYMILQDPFSSPAGIRVLILANTQVTPSAIEKFKQKYPDCEVQN